MIGQIVFSPIHRGNVCTINGRTYILLNGQSASRNTYPDLSSIWPSGTYGGGSTATNMNMPDTNNLLLRGVDLGRGGDEQAGLRVALSGFLPSGTAVGSYQAAALRSHSHVSGSQNGPSYPPICPGGEGAAPYQMSGLTATTINTVLSPSASTRPVAVLSGANDPIFQVDHTKCYFYIRAI